MIVVEVVVELAILMTMVVAVVVYDSGGTGIGGGVGDGGDDGYYKCVIKPPISRLDFPNLTTFCMTNVTIDPATEFCVFKSPRLVVLHLIYCDGTQYLNIVSPRLESLYVSNSHYLVLNYFVNCNNLRRLRIRSDKLVDVLEPVESSTLKKFFFQVADTVQALNLDSLLLDVYGAAEIAEAVSEYLKTPACLNQPLNKLKHVTLGLSGASESGLTFTKLLLSRTPSLVRMRTHGYKSSGYEEELLRFPRASPKAKLIIT
ncbi:hypothetical protein FXO38_34251 [Capsicum annuum]|uniref:FBD domain-containing protein n=1 Tax=Capsicum annuum TaxID=4072 RepID=A0A2G2Y0G6_CAPAN|nr:hypothetical protein FXO38_34251 [Capsicum annuum]KAF3656302.1 hypothetical protein FXO37_15550 [Capsicum annuum]PHT63235.1 hypothetical protein T459_32950 [Capsicum annuum]